VLALGWLVCEGAVRDPRDIEELQESGAPAGYAAEMLIGLRVEAAERLSLSLAPGEPRSALPATPARTPASPRAGVEPAVDLRPVLEDRKRLAGWFLEMFERADLRARVGGVHTGGLVLGGRLLAIAEDVSRHHVVDRLVGIAFRDGLPLGEAVLLLSARISGAMAAKACRAGVGALVSRSVPTELAASIAGANGLILVGRARQEAPHYYWPAGESA
jgi:formate dehydrogenase assembly factor FdhD